MSVLGLLLLVSVTDAQRIDFSCTLQPMGADARPYIFSLSAERDGARLVHVRSEGRPVTPLRHPRRWEGVLFAGSLRFWERQSARPLPPSNGLTLSPVADAAGRFRLTWSFSTGGTMDINGGGEGECVGLNPNASSAGHTQ